MAPADVLSEEVAVQITYVKAANVEDLHKVGVRIVGVEELAELIVQAKDELFPNNEVVEVHGASPGARSAPMRLPTASWSGQKWQNTIYMPSKQGVKRPWEVSYERWANGETINSIAMQQANGKPVEPSTVFSHLLTPLTFAKTVDLARMFKEADSTPPNDAEWAKLEDAAAACGANLDSADYKSKEVLGGVLGVEKVGREAAEKSQADRDEEISWYGKIRIWEALKR